METPGITPTLRWSATPDLILFWGRKTTKKTLALGANNLCNAKCQRHVKRQESVRKRQQGSFFDPELPVSNLFGGRRGGENTAELTATDASTDAPLEEQVRRITL